MGYYTRFDGEIRINPPLTWAQIKDSAFLPEPAQRKGTDVKLNVVEETTETDEGTITRRYATGVVPLMSDGYKGHNIVDTVNKLIAAYPNHTFSGRFDCEGEDAGDLWRLVIRGNRAVKVEPQIVWPDDAS